MSKNKSKYAPLFIVMVFLAANSLSFGMDFSEDFGIDFSNGSSTSGNCNKEIFDAIEKDDLKKVKIILEGRREGYTCVNEHGERPLHVACRLALLDSEMCDKKIDIVERLLEAEHLDSIIEDFSLSVDSVDELGNTPLYLACFNANLEIIRLLLSYCFEETVNKASNNGNTPLDEAFFEGNFDMVKLILPRCTEETVLRAVDKIFSDENSDENPIALACKHNDLDFVELLLKKGVYKLVNKTNYKGNTPLYYACKKGNLALIKLLLEYGANFDQKAFDFAAAPITGMHGNILLEEEKKKARILEYLSIIRDFENLQDDEKIKFILGKKTKSSEDGMCSICQYDIVGENKKVTLKCKHFFHENCIGKWLKENDTCPNCRAIVYTMEEDYLFKFLVRVSFGMFVQEISKDKFKHINSTLFYELYNRLEITDLNDIFGVQLRDKNNIREFIKVVSGKRYLNFDYKNIIELEEKKEKEEKVEVKEEIAGQRKRNRGALERGDEDKDDGLPGQKKSKD